MDFKVTISGRNIEITDRIQSYIDKGVAKLGRFLNDIDVIHVILTYTESVRQPPDKYTVEFTIHSRNVTLRAEERASDVRVAIDTALDRLQRQIERYKGKKGRNRPVAITAGMETQKSMAKEKSAAPLIVRRKTFDLIPMDEVEAIEQMQLLGHENFFVFFNANTKAINILYVRRDGTYGLIEPRI